MPQPPATWDEMIAMAEQLKSEGKPYEIGLTAAQYEGYVVNVNTFVNGFGGSLVNDDSTKATVTDGDGATKGLDLIKNLATSGLTSASLSNDTETEIFGSLQNDKSAFSINWPYVGSAMKTANPEMAAKLGLVPGAQLRVEETTNSLRLHRPLNHLAKVYIEPTDACNIECVTCFRNAWDTPMGRMSEETFSTILAGLAQLDPVPTCLLYTSDAADE